MNKFLLIIIGASFFSNYVYGVKHVAITQIVDHPALNAVRDSCIATINKCQDAPEKIKLTTTDANGNLVLAGQIAQGYLSERPDVIVAIATPSAQTVLNAVRDQIPLVFAAVTDPVHAKLVNPKEPTKNLVTGVTDIPPFKEQVEFIRKVLPHIKNLGVIYNAGEDNSRAGVEMLKKAAQELKIHIIEATISKSAEIPQATLQLTDHVDAIYIPNDNLIASSISSVIKSAQTKKIPVFAADILLVSKGALGMIGIDYNDVGTQVGEIVCQLLDGKSIDQIPIANPTYLKTYLNMVSAKRLGIKFNKELIDSADKVFDEN